MERPLKVEKKKNGICIWGGMLSSRMLFVRTIRKYGYFVEIEKLAGDQNIQLEPGVKD